MMEAPVRKTVKESSNESMGIVRDSICIVAEEYSDGDLDKTLTFCYSRVATSIIIVMTEEIRLVTIHLSNQTSYISTAAEFEAFLETYKETLKSPNPVSLLKINLATPGEGVAIDTAGSFEAYLNPNAIAMVDYI
jgi:hypothetical protein